jgi:hypothetical protein
MSEDGHIVLLDLDESERGRSLVTMVVQWHSDECSRYSMRDFRSCSESESVKDWHEFISSRSRKRRDYPDGA